MKSKNLSVKSKRKPQTPPKPLATIYTDTYADMTLGAPVAVTSARTEGKRGLRWTFLRHVQNTVTNSEWIDVLDKEGTIRSFKVSEVSLIKPKRKYTRRK